jgi:hypothetical protein
LGLADDQRELTAEGRRVALAAEEERRELLRAAVLRYPPYASLLEAIQARGDGVTDAEWIETWWATRGYGGSASNRHEGVAAFGRLVDELGIGRYVPGRRGHPTRIEWRGAAAGPVEPAAKSEPASEEASGPARATAEPVAAPAPEEIHRLVVPLGEGRVARVEVPARLPREEKRRLLELLELLIGDR